MIKRFCILLLLLFQLVHAIGQNGNAMEDSTDVSDTAYDEATWTAALLPIDTILSLHSIQIDPDSIRLLKNKREFGYIQNLDSALKAVQDKENADANAKPAKAKRSIVNDFLQAPFLRTLLILLALFFVAVILYHLLKDQAIFRKASPTMPAKEVTVYDDDLLQNDYDKLVQQALKSGDYRLGVRYLFLKTLQELRDKNIINYSRDKTNSRYAAEVPRQWRNDFSRLVLHYEYAWYGNFPVSPEQFSLIEKHYTAFLQKI